MIEKASQNTFFLLNVDYKLSPGIPLTLQLDDDFIFRASRV
ncbi:hypothetical protein SRABI27_01293 [Pedobacter sp. Bi27]|nr:hypothetical protein SRABI27_01293 [Pedobacter sp. Bi27]CAH0291951.1 hypothetical protein SRABI36_04337 [Pedobacter sp. Bi36]CAH0303343.1 hypothetical protein SRABI126_04458 [Pedobacter sp. Bi126]